MGGRVPQGQTDRQTDRQTPTPHTHNTQTNVPVLNRGAHAKVTRGGRQLSGDLGNQSTAGRQGLLPPNGHQVGRVEVGVQPPPLLVARDGLADIEHEVVLEVGGLGVVECGDGLDIVLVDNLDIGLGRWLSRGIWTQVWDESSACMI